MTADGAAFEPMSYFDRYREAVQTVDRYSAAGEKATLVSSFEAGDANSLLQTLEQSLSAAPRNKQLLRT